MIIAISQFNGDLKNFECLMKENNSYFRSGYNGSWLTRDHYYDSDIRAESFFILEQKYHLSFKLEFIT